MIDVWTIGVMAMVAVVLAGIGIQAQRGHRNVEELIRRLTEKVADAAGSTKSLDVTASRLDASMRRVEDQLALLNNQLQSLQVAEARQERPLPMPEEPAPRSLFAPQDVDILHDYRSLGDYVSRTPSVSEVETKVAAFVARWAVSDAGEPPRAADMRSTVWIAKDHDRYLGLPGYPFLSDPASIAAGAGYVGAKMLGSFFEIHIEKCEGRMGMQLVAPALMSRRGSSWLVADKGRLLIHPL